MKKIVIVGGGVSGLTAGIYARKKGYETLILEKHYVAGGQLTGWQRKGHHIDNCIHWLTGTNPNTADYKLWREIGMLENDEIYQSESLFTYVKDGVSLSLYKDLNRLQKEMLALSPADEKRIKDFIFAVLTVQRICGTGGERHDEKLAFLSAIFRLPRLYKYVKTSVGELAKTFDNQVIRGFLCSILTEYFSSLALITVFATFTANNGGLPKGGSLKAARRIVETYENLGGKIALKTTVEKINVDGKKAYSVTDSEGNEYFADAVIITAEPKTTFGSVLNAEMPRKIKKLYLGKKTERFSAVQCAFSCDADKIDFCGDLIIDLDEETALKLGSKRLVLREFTHEPSFAPAGKTVLQAMLFLKEEKSLEYVRAKSDAIKYEKMKANVSGTVRSAIKAKFSSIGELVLLDVWTPATYNEFTGTEIGSFMSFAFTGGYLPLKASGKIKGLKNVFLASQWLRAPGGLPIAANIGRSSVKYLDKYFAREFKRAPAPRKKGSFSFKRQAKTADR